MNNRGLSPLLWFWENCNLKLLIDFEAIYRVCGKFPFMNFIKDFWNFQTYRKIYPSCPPWLGNGKKFWFWRYNMNLFKLHFDGSREKFNQKLLKNRITWSTCLKTRKNKFFLISPKIVKLGYLEPWRKLSFLLKVEQIRYRRTHQGWARQGKFWKIFTQILLKVSYE